MLTPARASLYACGLLLVLPFLQPYHRFPLTSFYSEWLALALGLLAALLLLRRQPGGGAAFPLLALAPLCLVLVLALQTALGRVAYPEQALIAALYLIWSSVLLMLGWRLVQELGLTTVVNSLAWFVLAGGMLSSLVGLIQHYEFSTPFGFLVLEKIHATVYGNLGQSNHYAAHLAIALASAVYLHARRQLGDIGAVSCFAVLLLMSGLAASRSSWLYLAAFLALALLFWRIGRTVEGRKLSLVTMLLVPGFLVAQAAATFILPAGFQVTSTERLFHVASGLQSRIELWGVAWRMFLDAPILGGGWGQFAWHYFVSKASINDSINTQLYNHAHNVAFHLLAETGIAGVVIVFGAAVMWLYDLRKTTITISSWWMFALLAVIGVHSMLEFPLWYSYFLGPTALLLGVGAQRAVHIRSRRTLQLTIAFCILAGSLHLFGVLRPYREFERLLFIPEARVAARSDDELLGPAIASVHREPLLAPYAELAIAYSVAVSRDRLPQKIEFMARAMHFAPAAVVVYRYALLLALAGRGAEALQQLRLSMAAYPDELNDVIPQLEALARSYPVEFTPLLELASAERAQRGTPAAN